MNKDDSNDNKHNIPLPDLSPEEQEKLTAMTGEIQHDVVEMASDCANQIRQRVFIYGSSGGLLGGLGYKYGISKPETYKRWKLGASTIGGLLMAGAVGMLTAMRQCERDYVVAVDRVAEVVSRNENRELLTKLQEKAIAYERSVAQSVNATLEEMKKEQDASSSKQE